MHFGEDAFGGHGADLLAEEVGDGPGAEGRTDSGDENGFANGEKAERLFPAFLNLGHEGGVGLAEFGEGDVGGADADAAEDGAPVSIGHDGGAWEDAGGVGADKVGGSSGDTAAGEVFGNRRAAGGTFDDAVKSFEPRGGDVGGAGKAGDVGGTGEEVDRFAIESGVGALRDEDPIEADAGTAGSLGKDVLAEARGIPIWRTGDERLRLVVANIPRLSAEGAQFQGAGDELDGESSADDDCCEEQCLFPRTDRDSEEVTTPVKH